MSAFKFYRRKAGTQGLLIDSRRFVRGKSKFPFSAPTRRPAKFRATSPKSNTKSTIRRAREFQTAQTKEALLTDTKAKATINNALFGRYFFTCDETLSEDKTVHLIEADHSRRAKFPSRTASMTAC
jgi:hypothetical protein